MMIANYKTKKQFREAVEKDASNVLIIDPSIYQPVNGGQPFPVSALESDDKIYVTNHPKRSWYAEVYKKAERVVVK